MTTASVVDITAQFYTIDGFADYLRKDFADRGTIATVDVDEWGPELLRGTPQVIVSYEEATFAEPSGPWQPGVVIDVPGTNGASQARALLDLVQGFILRIHAPRIGPAETAAAGGRRATDQLVRQTLRAIRRGMAGPLRMDGVVEWPKKTDPDVLGYAAFTYGSLARLRFVIASSVLDDEYDTGTVTELETDGQLSIDGGATYLPISDTYTQPVPPT